MEKLFLPRDGNMHNSSPKPTCGVGLLPSCMSQGRPNANSETNGHFHAPSPTLEA